jgi:signal transduction histidine kinase
MAHRRGKKRFKRDSRKSLSTVPHASVLQRDGILWRAAVDNLADISDLPLAIFKRPQIQELFKELRQKSAFFKKTFQTFDDFRKLAAAANADPVPVMRQLSDSANEWKSIFALLSRQIIVGPSARQEPVLRLLRYHWSWRWTEILAFCDCFLDWNTQSPPLRFYDHFAANVFLCEFIEIDGSTVLMVGPVKNKHIPAQTCADALKALVKKYYQVGNLKPVHPIERYEQFFYDKTAIYLNDLRSQKKILRHAIRLSNSIEWPSNHEVDYFDITAAAEFTYCLADIAFNPLGQMFKPYRQDLSISYNYPLYLGSDRKRTRQLRYHVIETKAGYDESIEFLNTRVDPKASALFATVRSSTLDVNTTTPAVDAYLNQHFELGARRRRVAQSQRLLEELLILRYLLADNFGVFTSDQDEGPSGVDYKLGRRIARTVTNVCHCDSAVIYQFDHLNNLLYSVGVHVDDGIAEPLGRLDHRWMENVGRDKNLKFRSVAYTAAEEDRIVEYNDSSEFSPLVYNKTTKVNPPRKSRLVPGKSIVAIPIRVFGRLWGILEVHSKKANSFSYPQLEWLAKIADLVGPYYHEQIIIYSLYQIASAPEVLVGEDNQFNLLARQAAGIFLCNTACVWIRDLFNTDQYNCAGFTGRPDLEARINKRQALPSFSSQGKKSVARDAIDNKRIWVEGSIGIEPFGNEWLNKEHTRSLKFFGFKYIAIMPIYDLEENAIAVISVYSRHRPFSSKWENWARYIGNYMGVVITRIHNAKEVEAQFRSLVAHEIINAVDIVKGAAENFATFVRHLPRGVQRSDIFASISDIDTHVGDIETAVGDWVTGRDVKKGRRSQAMLLATAQQRSKTIPIPVNFRTEFNSCVAPLHREMSRRGIRYHIVFPKGGLLLKMHAEDFRMILNNLIRNAVKYSPHQGQIFFEFVSQAFGTKFSVRNRGPALGQGELYRVFNLGFRGKNVRDKYPGSGLGLYLVKQLCEFYDIGVRYDAPGDADEDGFVWHRIDLDFPAKMVMTSSSTGQ